MATPRGENSGFCRRRAYCRRLGRRGERLAARLLTELGLDILTRNYRAPTGEIDIVARDGETLCFVEVKTRRRFGRARPGAAVGAAKQRAIIRTARRYLRRIGRPPIAYRYDVVEIVLGRRVEDIRYRPGAFTEERARADSRFPTLADWFEDVL